MRRRSLSVVCWIVLISATALAQLPPRADSLSGNWGDSGATFLELRFDGKGTVSGTVIWRGDGGERRTSIKSGTFDATTGALKLTGEDNWPSGTVRTFVIEGTVDGDTVKGNYVFGGEKGQFSFRHQDRPQAEDNAATAAARRSFAEVSSHIMKAADLVPADQYGYRPSHSVRTFGQLVGHIVDGYNYYCATAAGRKVDWSDAIEKGPTDKATLVQELKEATDRCKAPHATGQISALVGNIAHSNLHYGNIVTYVRMLGLVPPSS